MRTKEIVEGFIDDGVVAPGLLLEKAGQAADVFFETLVGVEIVSEDLLARDAEDLLEEDRADAGAVLAGGTVSQDRL